MARYAIRDGAAEPQRLMEAHAAIDQRVRELDRRVGLTSGEQIELAELKKQKLALKDRFHSA